MRCDTDQPSGKLIYGLFRLEIASYLAVHIMLHRILLALFGGKVWPVLLGPLAGTRLRLTNLVKARSYVQKYEPDKQRAFDFFLKKESIFFDIGANIGLHSYYVARKFPDAKIFSFEPLPANARYIRESIKRNHFLNIQLIETAVSSTNGEAFFDIKHNNSEGMLTATETGLKVKAVTIDEFVRQSALYPDVVKVDVEGAESLVLEGAKRLMETGPPVFIVELHNPEQDIKVARLLVDNGYIIKRLNQDTVCKPEELFIEIKNIHASWPDPNGVWGSIVATPIPQKT
jgi:FkbM family methyltransferase